MDNQEFIEDGDEFEYVMDDDYVITSGHRGGYEVFQTGKLVLIAADWNIAIQGIRIDSERNQFWPNVWYQGERGDMNLLDGMGNYVR